MTSSYDIKMTSTHLIKCLASLYSSLTAGYLSCKQATVQTKQAVRTEHSENVLPILKKKSEINWSFGQLPKMCPTTLFSLLITTTLLTYKYKWFWRLNARVLEANILSSENHHYIQNSSQTKQTPTLSRVCSSKSQTWVEKPLRLRDWF